ncbi:MAG TPA: hypothetical protein VN428_06040, partial [Bryobacteraceae bacterium]|nr:hypothetical protein [Bryobacteraceae bacterium]
EQSFADQVRDARSAIGSEEDESRAASLLERAAPELPYVPVEQMVAFTDVLLELRRDSAEQGDQAFAAALEALMADRTAALQALFATGNYVFGPSRGSEQEIESREAGSGVAFRLEFDRPGATEAAAVAYFEAAVAVLDASSKSGDEAELDRQFASQLMPHARRLAPDIAEDFARIARRLGVADSSVDAERPEVSRAAEGQILARFRLHWVTGQSHSARETISGLLKQPARQQMNTLADFAEAREALRTKQPDLATAISYAMAGGAHKTLVHLGLAAYALAQKSPEGARDLAFLALREALTAPPEHRPGLQIIAARVLSKVDTEAAFGTLSYAVDSLNAIDAARPHTSTPVRLTNWGFSEAVALAHERRSFALVLPGLPSPDLGAAVADLAAIDAARTEDILFRLRSERRLAEALVTLSARTLELARVQ